MSGRIVILSEREEAPLLRLWLAQATGGQPALARDLDGLRALIEGREEETRLISFLTDVVTPGDVIDALGPEPYNIHPGPPEYRGSHADSFALYEGASSFGVTGHAMTAEIDAGEIVYLKRFAVPEGARRLDFAELVLSHAVEAFAAVAMACSTTDQPLARRDVVWSGPRRTKAAFRALCRPRASVGAEEIARRARACGPDFSPDLSTESATFQPCA
ncbi:MAG: formyltransferase family protein [Pseudomonadota bacterium]